MAMEKKEGMGRFLQPFTSSVVAFYRYRTQASPQPFVLGGQNAAGEKKFLVLQGELHRGAAGEFWERMLPSNTNSSIP